MNLLICDVDNTLFDWNAYYASSFRAMVHVASRELAVPEDLIYEQLKEVHQRYQSIEYTYSLQELPVVQSLEVPRLREVLDASIGAFNSVKRRRLRPFPDVRPTLEWVALQQYTIVAVSNAPMHQAYRRIERLGLRRYFDGLVCWEGWKAKSREDPLVGHRMGGELEIKLPWHKPLRQHELKPSAVPYQSVLDHYGLHGGSLWVVGDSLSSDIAPAGTLGIRTIWARYGSLAREKDIETLLRVTDWSDSQVRALRAAGEVIPDFAIDSFSGLREVLPESQPSLFGALDQP